VSRGSLEIRTWRPQGSWRGRPGQPGWPAKLAFARKVENASKIVLKLNITETLEKD